MDRISGLSDELLVKILLLVPTKVAVSTSILSKRWEFLWMWLPKLDYSNRDSSSPSECESLRCFLDKNLPLHRAPVLESFRLDLRSGNFEPENIKMWVLLAIYHRVRELEIMYYLYQSKADILPSNLYIYKSLVTLKLQGEILLDIPRMVFLPSLKTLKIQSVIYFNEESLQRLLSNCPVLEHLRVDLRTGDTMGNLTIIVPSLLSLSLFIPYLYSIDEVVIQTPSLKYFKLQDHRDDDNESHYCLIENMPNLIEAYIDVEFPNINNLIGSITSVNHLSICSEAIYDKGFVFNQLEHLEFCICKEHSNLLVPLLKDSPNLQVLDLIEMDYHEEECDMDYWNQPSTVPECLLLSLQTFNCLAYTGTPKDKDVAAYILKHALHLKMATITAYECDVPRDEMIKELTLSSRASTTCQLKFDCIV